MRLILTNSVLAEKVKLPLGHGKNKYIFTTTLINEYDQQKFSCTVILLSSNLLEGTCDDEVGMIHRNQVSSELA